MPIDESIVGRRFPTSDPYRVSREKIAEFANAIGDANPAYRSAAAARQLGHRDVVAPPTFAVILGMTASRQLIDNPEIGVDFSRVVHVDQRFSLERAICAGDQLTATLVVDGLRAAAGNQLIDHRVEVNDTDGKLVATMRSTFVLGPDAEDDSDGDSDAGGDDR